MSQSPLVKAVLMGESKANWLKVEPLRFLFSAFVAGSYLTIIGFLYWTIRQNFGAAPEGKFLASLFFGVGLSVIVFTRCDLFTSSNMYLTLSTLARRTDWGQTCSLWAVCYVGNLIGAVCIAGLLLGAGALAGITDSHVMVDAAQHKINYTSSELFFKGFLANWLVCLAVWVNLHLKDDGARLSAIILIIFVFLYLGFEHSIANMGTFAVVLASGTQLNADGIAHNLLWSTLGNIMGGGAGVGLVAWLLMKRTERNEVLTASAESLRG